MKKTISMLFILFFFIVSCNSVMAISIYDGKPSEKDTLNIKSKENFKAQLWLIKDK